MPSNDNFANVARIIPYSPYFYFDNPKQPGIKHIDGSITPYTCHMAVMHWAFLDLDDNAVRAQKRVEPFTQEACSGCQDNDRFKDGAMHTSMDNTWYGPNVCSGTGAMLIERGHLGTDDIEIGDVLITSSIESPMHSMVVVGKDGADVYIRGFNNWGTLGTGNKLEYDDEDQNINQDKYWNRTDDHDQFGLIKADLYRISYRNYISKIEALLPRISEKFQKVD